MQPLKRKQPFMAHLMELRARLVICLLTLVLFMVLALIFHKELFKFMCAPLDTINLRLLDEKINALSADNPALESLLTDRERLRAGEEPSEAAPIYKLRARGPTSGFLIILKIGLWGGIMLALPLFISQLWSFVSPGLHSNERKAIAPIFWFGLVFLLLGAALAYLYVVPTALDYLIAVNEALGLERTLRVEQYVGFVIQLMFAFGLAFELPLVILALSHLGLVTPAWLWKQKRYAVLASVVVGALLTPPDIISQIILAGCMLVLYFFSILLSQLVWRKKAAAEESKVES